MPSLANGVRVRLSAPSVRIRAGMPTSKVIALPVRGPQGLPGSAAATYHHVQSSLSSEWVVNHSLGRKPPLELFLDDSPTIPVWTDIEYPDDNTVLVHLPDPATGHVYM